MNDNTFIGDGRMAQAKEISTMERMRLHRERLNAAKELIEYRRKHYSLNTVQAKWLIAKAGLTT